MKKLVLIACLVSAAACDGVGERRSSLEALPDLVKFINEDGTEQFKKEFGDSFKNITLSARIDDGKTLVLIMENAPLGNSTFDPQAAQKALRPQICGSENYRELIEEGGRIRVEMTSNFGKKLPAIQFARCD